MKIPKHLRPQYSTREFLAVLVVLFVSGPFIERYHDPRLLWSTLLTATLLSAGLAVGDSRSTKLWAMLAAAPAIVLTWAHHFNPAAVPLRWGHGLIWLFATWVSVRLFRYVLQAESVGAELLSAAVATYLMAAMAWAAAYIVIGDLDANAFAWVTGPASSHVMQGFTALYFSLATISTVAYGDIMPLSSLARLAAMAEAVGGLLYMTLLVARLVSAYSGKTSGKEP